MNLIHPVFQASMSKTMTRLSVILLITVVGIFSLLPSKIKASLPADNLTPENVDTLTKPNLPNKIKAFTPKSSPAWPATFGYARPSGIDVGNVDASFVANVAQGSPKVYSLATQSDDKFLVGGNFTAIDGTATGSLERFNSDGTRDSAFNAGGAGANNSVYVIIVLADGKIIIAGNCTLYNGASAPRIARLNADGTLDATFTAQGSSANAAVQDMIIQPDG